MQGVKERPKEATLTTMQTTLNGCGLEGVHRRRVYEPARPNKKNNFYNSIIFCNFVPLIQVRKYQLASVF